MDAGNRERLRALARFLGLTLTAEQELCFDRNADLLAVWYRRFNLTAITAEEDVVVKHFADSLSLVPQVRALWRRRPETGADGAPGGGAGRRAPPDGTDAAALVVLGAGAGFPGIPLKIYFGGALSVTLIDAAAKKVHFMNEVVGALGLTDCRAVHSRAEDAARKPEYRARFRFATARALAAMPVLVEYALPFLARGGAFIAMKAQRESAERECRDAQKALTVLGGQIVEQITFPLPSLLSAPAAPPSSEAAPPASPPALSRTLIVVEKVADTPNRYPRKAGTPAKAPLGTVCE
jgi:16S rRNA (guanine527-N7)-methyltransferase